MDVTGAPGKPNDVYVVLKQGQVRIVRSGRLVKGSFLDVSSSVDSTGEGGLISLAFANNYAATGNFYVYLTDASGVRISRFTRSAANPDRADASSELVLLTGPKSALDEHYAGEVNVGPDGTVYAVIGDEGVPANGQDLSTLAGKMVRVNGDGSTLDNGVSGAPDATFASGLRNPFKWSFDRQTGDLVLADVGADEQDEVDYTPAAALAPGDNYGWNCFEGTFATPNSPTTCQAFTQHAPAFTIAHAGRSCLSVIGGYVSRDPDVPALSGRYVYGDWCTGEIRSLALSSPATTDATTGLNLASLTSFGEDACGRLYAASFDGRIVRIKQSGVRSTCP
jgi:glucose/arabinose dehydrogenase